MSGLSAGLYHPVCCSEAGQGEEEWPALPAPPQWPWVGRGVATARAAEQAETGPHGAWAGESVCLGTAQPPPLSPFGPSWPSLALAELKLSTLGLLQLPGHPSVPKGPTTAADPTWPSRPSLVQDVISGIETLLLEPPIATTSQVPFILKSMAHPAPVTSCLATGHGPLMHSWPWPPINPLLHLPLPSWGCFITCNSDYKVLQAPNPHGAQPSPCSLPENLMSTSSTAAWAPCTWAIPKATGLAWSAPSGWLNLSSLGLWPWYPQSPAVSACPASLFVKPQLCPHSTSELWTAASHPQACRKDTQAKTACVAQG